MSLKQTFTDIYRANTWGSKETRSGVGSELLRTIQLRAALDHFLKDSRQVIKSVLDIPCGDFNWISHLPWLEAIYPRYIGADIVDELVETNRKKYPYHQFEVLDVTCDKLPKVDLVLVRDLFGHLSIDNIRLALDNLRRNDNKLILTTSFPRTDFNYDVNNGGWRPLNLSLKPFDLIPTYLINEGCTEGYPDKSLVLFQL